MTEKLWDSVDRFIEDYLIGHDEVLTYALKNSIDANLPDINVTALQGKMLHILARLSSAKRILEIGTLGGYSTIWMARALPDSGRLITLEINRKHAEVASENLRKAGLSDKVSIIAGPAPENLARLHAERAEPFDMVFIDADKPGIPEYLEWALKLSHPGTLIIVDNVVREGSIIDPENRGPGGEGVVNMFAALRVSGKVTATAIQTVGSKGHDGFAMVLVN